MRVYLAAQYFQIYLCKCFYNYSWVKEQEPINFSLRESSRFYATIIWLKSSYIFGYMFYKLCWIVNVSIFTSSYS